MHNLEGRIVDWKKQLAHSESLSSDDVSELEQHLRESVADLQTRGLSLDEALLVATSRLGTRNVLDAEFGKVNGSLIWKRRVFWMLAGYLLVRFAGALISTLTSVAAFIAAYTGTSGSVQGAISVCLTVLGWGCLLACIYGLTLSGGCAAARQISTLHPVTLISCTLGAIVGGAILSLGSQVIVARLSTAETLGQKVLVTTLANHAMQLVIPLVCVGMMVSLWRHRQLAA